METKVTPAAIRRGKRIFKAARDRQRGYSIVGKQLFVAYLIEAAIIGSGAAAGYQFANRYAGDAAPTQVASLGWIGAWVEPSSNNGWWMAIIATIGICVAEMARVPLAQAVRTHRSWAMKTLATIGVIMMCIVTTKTMSQVMEQMFHPRLRFVQEATLKANEANMELATLAADRKAAVAAFDPLDVSVKAIDKRIDTLGASLAQQGAKPPQREEKIFHRNKKTGKKWTTSVFHDVPWAGDNLQTRIDAASAERIEAVAKRNAAAARLNEIDQRIAAADAVVTERAGAKTKAVAESQLHSFTAMVFGKDPVEVTDAEVHWFLRFFVFIPAIMIAVSSTLLAMTAYRTTPKARRIESLSLDLQMVPSLRKHLGATGAAS